tara:strand:+ start:1200 stop:1826 length:627 start_codon:yes stop_codon:yes gene_type:complete
MVRSSVRFLNRRLWSVVILGGVSLVVFVYPRFSLVDLNMNLFTWNLTSSTDPYLEKRWVREVAGEIVRHTEYVLSKVSYPDDDAMMICREGGNITLPTIVKQHHVTGDQDRFVSYTTTTPYRGLMLINIINEQKHVQSVWNMPTDLREKVWQLIDSEIEASSSVFHLQLGLPCNRLLNGHVSEQEANFKRWTNLNKVRRVLLDMKTRF